MGNVAMVKCCLSFVLNGSVLASADVPQRPCSKAFKFASKTRVHTPISAAASGRNIRPLAGSIRKPLQQLRTPRFTPIIWRPLMPPCADGVQPIAENQYLRQKEKTAPATPRCLLDPP